LWKTDINFVLVVFNQRSVWGHFQIDCKLENEHIQLKDVYGFFEHVHMRW
jgi:hypothetical protein